MPGMKFDDICLQFHNISQFSGKHIYTYIYVYEFCKFVVGKRSYDSLKILGFTLFVFSLPGVADIIFNIIIYTGWAKSQYPYVGPYSTAVFYI